MTKPVISATSGQGSATTCRPTVSSPNMPSAKASPTSARPRISGLPGLVGGMAGIFHATSRKPITPIGTLIQNTARQPKRSVKIPPSGGPVTGPSKAGIVSHAMAESSSSLRTPRNSKSRPTGNIMAPPAPCRMRKPIRSSKPRACPESAEAATKTIIASMKTRLAPKRSAIQLENGMKTVSATR